MYALLLIPSFQDGLTQIYQATFLMGINVQFLSIQSIATNTLLQIPSYLATIFSVGSVFLADTLVKHFIDKEKEDAVRPNILSSHVSRNKIFFSYESYTATPNERMSLRKWPLCSVFHIPSLSGRE